MSRDRNKCEVTEIERMAGETDRLFAEAEMRKTVTKKHTSILKAEALYNAGYRKQEWISVEERLPDMSGKYLVATFDGRVGIGNLIDYYCNGDLSFDNYKVTHWMPLPEAPKMKGGAE